MTAVHVLWPEAPPTFCTCCPTEDVSDLEHGSMLRCTAITRAGTRCRNYTDASKYHPPVFPACHVHRTGRP